MDPQDFIEVYPDALPADACAAMIARFEASGQATPGHSAAGVDRAIKDSRDIPITLHPEWADVDEQLNRAMFRGLVAYARKYPHLLLSPLSFHVPDPATGATRRMTCEDIAGYEAYALGEILRSVLRPGVINLQHYRADSGGYPAWHCELAPTHPDYLHRHLLWTIYLNEGFGGGETEFLYQDRKVVPRTGTLLLAPTAFTHTHRGNRPLGRDKYIATSWVLFKQANAIIGARS